MDRFVNPGVAEELRAEPDGDRAQKVMLLTLPSGREIPVNYLREGDRVYAGADGRVGACAHAGAARHAAPAAATR